MRMFFCCLLVVLGGDVLLACSLKNYTLYVERHECGHCMAINTTMCSGMCFTQVRTWQLYCFHRCMSNNSDRKLASWKPQRSRFHEECYFLFYFVQGICDNEMQSDFEYWEIIKILILNIYCKLFNHEKRPISNFKKILSLSIIVLAYALCVCLCVKKKKRDKYMRERKWIIKMRQ